MQNGDNPSVLAFQLTASSVESSAAMQSTWLRLHPLVVCRKSFLWTWTTALPCGPTLCALDAQRAVAGVTWFTTQLSSALRSYSPSTTVPAMGPLPLPRSPVHLDPPCLSCATMRAGSWSRARPASKRNTPTVDYSETPTYGLSGISFRPAR